MTLRGLRLGTLTPWLAVAAGAALLVGAPSALPVSRTTLGVLAVVAAIAISAGYVVWHARPEHVFSAALVASLFSGSWGQFGLPGSFAPDRLLLVGVALSVVLRSPRATDRPRFRLGSVHMLLIAVSLYVIGSAAWAGTIGESSAVFRLVDRFGLVLFGVFVLAPLVFHGQAQRRVLLGTLVGIGAYLGLTALFETTGPSALVLPHYISDPLLGNHAGRARGPFLEAEADGMAMFICAVAAMVALGVWRRRSARLLAYVVIALCAAGTFFTLQRAVWLGVIAGTLVGFLAVPRLRRLLVPALAIGVVLVAASLALIPGFRAKVDERTQGTSASRSVWDRQNLNAAALRLAAAHPLTGVGWQRFQDRVEPYFRESPDYPLSGSLGGRIQVAHNVFLSNAAELGLVGLVLWLCAIAAVFGTAILRRGPPELVGWRSGLLAIVVMWTWAGVLCVGARERFADRVLSGRG